MILDPNSFQVTPKKKQFDKWKSDFVRDIAAINGKLVNSPYLAGNKSTMADYIVYNELS